MKIPYGDDVRLTVNGQLIDLLKCEVFTGRSNTLAVKSYARPRCEAGDKVEASLRIEGKELELADCVMLSHVKQELPFEPYIIQIHTYRYSLVKILKDKERT